MGGLVQSSAVAANLRAEGLIDNAQILLAMLVGSAVGNPFRTLRRNLPSALGIFPVPVAFAIVIGMQLSRSISIPLKFQRMFMPPPATRVSLFRMPLVQ